MSWPEKSNEDAAVADSNPDSVVTGDTFEVIVGSGRSATK
ncbi:hypothetical protein GFS60_03558 [Rhodococcus sp. WAY2]|nr:hypothetical protein GFS60_03558 [Rhodococcus sp. WAY2]